MITDLQGNDVFIVRESVACKSMKKTKIFVQLRPIMSGTGIGNAITQNSGVVS